MKIAWLVWTYEDTEFPCFTVKEPYDWVFKRVQIVYSEIIT